jgi:RNA recognition motif-containing protein
LWFFGISFEGKKHMSRELFVGNLPYSATEESLTEYFVQTGRSRGFGFVKMESDEGAAKAIQDLDGKEYAGRELKVNEAGGGNAGGGRRPGGPRQDGGGFRSRDGGGAPRGGERRPYRN